MKLNPTFSSFARPQGRRAVLAGLAALAVAAFCSVFPVSRASAEQEIKRPEAVAELDQLLADFHGALSYGGNLTAMTSLWVENSSLTFNGAPNVGKAAVLSFFTSGGYFHNNWVSLAPEYKTMIKVHGDTADFTTQCVAIDLSVTPNVVKSVIQVTGTAVRVNGKWIFKSMNNTSPAPL
jgi:hypothetical protein